LKNLVEQPISKVELQLLDEFDKTTSTQPPSYPVEWSDDYLKVIGAGSICIKALYDSLSTDVMTGFKQTIISISTSGSLAKTTLSMAIRAFKKFVESTKATAITVATLSLYHETNVNDMVLLRPFLNRWFKIGYTGVNEETVNYLNKLNLSSTHRPSGSRVRSDNPEEGWFTEQEYDDLVSIIWDDYEHNRVSLQNTLIQLLTAQYSRRPIQMAQLKIADIKCNGETLSVSGIRIEFPGAKEQGTTGFRDSKLEVHPLSDELWALCQLQIQDSTSYWEEILQRKLTAEEIELLPLFTTAYNENVQKKVQTAQQYSSSSLDFIGSEYLHVSSLVIKHTLYRTLSGCTSIISHRTNRPLIVNAYRYRYTRAKQLARLGIPRIALQYWLGHSWGKSLDAYYDDPAERARILEDGMGQLLTPLAQAFRGTLVDTIDDALQGDEKNRLQLDGKDELSVGGCGNYGFCGASVPIPCYRCSKFRPWVYGPHVEVLDRLLERQRQESNIPLVGQGRILISPLNLDKEITAVRNVITRCEERQKELENDSE
tara:strand:+ start:1432 stop:3057 length:1626 start_codon:yes stop_codon:yes gene_type:complete